MFKSPLWFIDKCTDVLFQGKFQFDRQAFLGQGERPATDKKKLDFTVSVLIHFFRYNSTPLRITNKRGRNKDKSDQVVF